MPCTASRALIALLVFASPSVIFADTDNWIGHHGLSVQRPVSTMSNGRTSVSRRQLPRTEALDRIDWTRR
jgi:hypothetical protein